MANDEKTEEKIIRLMREGSKPKRRAPRKKPEEPKPTISNAGSGKVIYVDGTGNVVGNTFVQTEKVVRRTTVKTGDGTLSAEQKFKLKEKVDEAVRILSAVRKTPRTHQQIWSGLNKYMKVNSYHEIKAENFEKAMKWLLSQLAIVNGMSSAAKKSPTWRTTRYRGINARCRNFDGGEERMRNYMAATFDKTSQRDLTDSELEKLYRHIMGWKK